MKVHEAAKLKKMSNKDFIKMVDDPRITSHMNKLPEELEAELFGEEKKIKEAVAEPTQTVDSAETVVVETTPEPIAKTKPIEEPCPVDLVTLELSIRGIGGKSPYYKWKYLLDA